MRITLASGTPAELARRDDASRGLVVLPDIGGLRPLFDDHVVRLAAETGWSVCAPEPWPGREQLTIEERLAAVGTLDDERVLGDAVAAADATGCEAVGVLGFCMGGMYALKAAGTGRFHRAVAFYGMIRVPEQWQGPGQGQPLAALARPQACPVLAVIGSVDPWTPSADVEALEAAGAQVVRYEGADHGFVHDPDRPAHRPGDAADAWRRALEFLAE
ncbi:MAG: dienelactone hydrolase family protein [Acidimicrobiales bacterium]|jgi:carboxymethylenebutenolidase|nr:dienelactone hydrolase family protein [Acidimicrobiales bacterium]